jgi:hypothetical protein
MPMGPPNNKPLWTKSGIRLHRRGTNPAFWTGRRRSALPALAAGGDHRGAPRRALWAHLALHGSRRCAALSRAAAGIPSGTLHVLRDTAATLALTASVPVHIVAARLGDDPRTVLATYAHLLPLLPTAHLRPRVGTCRRATLPRALSVAGSHLLAVTPVTISCPLGAQTAPGLEKLRRGSSAPRGARSGAARRRERR